MSDRCLAKNALTFLRNARYSANKANLAIRLTVLAGKPQNQTPRINMHSENHFDVLIIGAGPAGTTAAYILARNGYRVGIIEKKSFPRSKLCAGLLTQKTVELLKEIFNTGIADLKFAHVIHHQSKTYGFGDRSGNFLAGELKFPFHFTDREIYDAFWLDRAAEAGAELFFKENAQKVDIAGGEITTRTGKRFAGRYIVAADGVFSRIQALLYQQDLLKCRRRQHIAAALERYIPLDCIPSPKNYPCIYWGYVPRGYAWSFPGPGYQILGMCSLKQNARQFLNSSFAHFLKDRGISSKTSSSSEGYALPYGNYLSKAGYKNILLIGDAAGFADPILGEGLYYAHRSAQLAAAAIKQSWSDPAKARKIYGRLLNKGVLTELKYMLAGSRFLFSLPVQWQSKLLAFMLTKIPDKMEEAIQRKRSFKLLLPTTRH